MSYEPPYLAYSPTCLDSEVQRAKEGPEPYARTPAQREVVLWASSAPRGCLPDCPKAPCPCAAACHAPSQPAWLPPRSAWSWLSGLPPRLQRPSSAGLGPPPSSPRPGYGAGGFLRAALGLVL